MLIDVVILHFIREFSVASMDAVLQNAHSRRRNSAFYTKIIGGVYGLCAQISPDQLRSAQISSDQLRSAQISSEQRSAHISLHQLSSVQISSCQLRAAQIMRGPARASHVYFFHL